MLVNDSYSAPPPPPVHPVESTESTHAEPLTTAHTGPAASTPASPTPAAASPSTPTMTPTQQRLYEELGMRYAGPPVALPLSLRGTTSQQLDTLKTALRGQPAQVTGLTLQTPQVQKLLQATAASITTTYTHSATNNKPYAAPLAASSSLVKAVQGLPSTYAAQILQEKSLLPTLKKIASYDPNTGAPSLLSPLIFQPKGGTAFQQVYTNLSKSFGAAGGAPAVANQVAQVYSKTLASSPALFDDPKTGAVAFATAHGASPDLSVALAAQAASTGHADAARSIVNTAVLGPDGSRIHALQGAIAQDVSQYNKAAGLVGAAQGLLTPHQLQQLLTHYTPIQGALSKISKDVGALNAVVGQLQGLPPSLKGYGTSLLGSVGQDNNTQQAVTILAKTYPDTVAGAVGKPGSTLPTNPAGFDSGTFAFWTDQAARNASMRNALASAYLTADVLPAFAQLKATHNSAAAVANVNTVLHALQGKAASLLGVSQSDADKGVSELHEILEKAVASGQTTQETVKAVSAQVKELRELPFSQGAGGTAFRALGVLLGGFATVGAFKGAGDSAKPSDIFNELSNGVGFAAAPAKLLTTMGESAEVADVAGFGSLAESTAGYLDGASFFAGAIQDVISKNYTDATFNALGGVGAVAATAGSSLAETLGVDLTPYGIGLAISAAAALYAHSQLNPDSAEAVKLLHSAGLPDAVAKTLGSNGLRNALQLQGGLNLSAGQMRILAQTSPELFSANPGETQAFIAVAQASGVNPSNTLAFAKDLATDAKNSGSGDYLSTFLSWTSRIPAGASPVGTQAALFQQLVSEFPTAGKLVATPEAVVRFQAERDFGNVSPSSGQPYQIATLLQQHTSPGYRAQVIQLMQQNGTLNHWLNTIATSHNTGWSQAATQAVNDATTGKNPLVTLTSEEKQSLRSLG